MGKYYDMLRLDVRMQEGLTACMNCGVCTGVCPAADFYHYDPRQLVSAVQTKDDAVIEELMRSDVIWYCGECMSCRPRCPRANTPGYVVQALRTLSQKLGFFADSPRGRQQLAIKRVIGQNILDTGYCLTPQLLVPEGHPEQGPVWKWIYDNNEAVFEQFSENYRKPGVGAMRKIDKGALDEIRAIFEVSGGREFFDNIESQSERKAHEMGYSEAGDDYIRNETIGR